MNYSIADKLRLMELTQNGFEGEEENQALVIRAADEIQRLERWLKLMINVRKCIRRKSDGEMWCIGIAEKALAGKDIEV